MVVNELTAGWLWMYILAIYLLYLYFRHRDERIAKDILASYLAWIRRNQ